MACVSPDAEGFFLSLEAMVNLDLINRESTLFPGELRRESATGVFSSQESVVQHPDQEGTEACACPERSLPPEPPVTLPFEAKPENNHLMKQRLLETFASSTFNTCPHKPLPGMLGPEVHIHIEKNVKPKAFHTPVTIPLHWQSQVYADLLRDEALGVIEKVPIGEPVDWCHRMLISRKFEGSPRRTVDLSPLNKFCKRETFSCESPFQIARRIPKHSWKSPT